MGREKSQDVVLRDGTTVRIRGALPEDAARIVAMWRRTSPLSQGGWTEQSFPLDAARGAALVDASEPNQRVLVATLGSGDQEEVVSIARYERAAEDETRAALDALVEDRHQRRGIATAMLRELIRMAREEGVKHFTGDILADNEPVLSLLRDLGLAWTRSPRAGQAQRTEIGVEETSDFLAAVARDEKLAARSALERFFEPRSVAVVGASRNPRSIGGLIFANILHGEFTGAVYPVNPKAPVVQAVTAYPSLSECPSVPDLVVVCVPPQLVPGVIDEAGKLGVRAACIITAGFAEAGPAGVELQSTLMETARGHGLRIVGPNCLGLANASAGVRMNATFSTLFPRPGRVSFSSQSGGMGIALIDHLEKIGLGLGSFVSVGNKSDISGNDLLLYWEDDPETDVILLYLESFGNPRKFSRIARRVSRSKPIVAVKSARSGAGVRAASSHTAALASGDVAVDALFRQAGVIRTDTLEELFDVATLLTSQPLTRGRRVAILTNGGGPGVLAADACEAQGLEVPELSDATKTRLREVLADEAGVGNPVDMIASGGAEHYRRSLEILGAADEVDAVIVIFTRPVYVDPSDVARALAEARKSVPAHKPILSVFISVKGVPQELSDARIPSFAFPEEAARALAHVARYAEWRKKPLGEVPEFEGLRRKDARAIVETALGKADGEGQLPFQRRGGGRSGRPRERKPSVWLSAEDAGALLACYGLTLARDRVVESPEEGADAQREFGRKVVVKAASSIHKTDVGAIRLGLDSPEKVAAAIVEMSAALREAGLEKESKRWLVQEMIDGGVEMAVGVTHDPSFGPLVMVGMGGTLVELHEDVSVRITPLSDVDVREMIDSLRMAPLLRGYRGAAPADEEALVDLVHRVGAMVEDIPEIAELDLNPVFVREQGVAVVDVRLRVEGR